MSAANLTVYAKNVATIESTYAAAYRITKDAVTVGLKGFLVNAGTKTAYLGINQAAGVSTTTLSAGAQAQGIIPLVAGGTLPWLSTYATIDHCCAGSDTTTLVWCPREGSVSEE